MSSNILSELVANPFNAIRSHPREWLSRLNPTAVVVLAAIVMCLPFLRSIWLLADEGIWLHAGLRLISGKILYRDFFEFHPPLGFLIVAGWMSVFGSTLVAMRLLEVVVVTLIAWLTLRCCRMMSTRTAIPVTLTLAWLPASQGMWTQINHHWFATMFSMIAFAALLSADDAKRTATGASARWLRLAGFAASAATLITTHRGAMAAFAGFVVLVRRRSLKALLHYAAGGLALLAAVLGFLAWQGTMGQAYQEVVLYPVRHYSNIQGVHFGAFPELQTAFVVGAFPLAAALFLVKIVRDGLSSIRQPKWDIALAFAFVGFFGCFPRPDSIHISFCVVLVLPLLAALLDQFLPKHTAGSLLPLIAICVIALPMVSWLAQVRAVLNAPQIATPAGRIAIIPRNGTAQIITRLQSLPPTDTVFFYPYDPVLPFLTKRHHPADLDLLVPQYSTPEQYLQTCKSIMANAQWVVMDTVISQPGFYRAVFPAMTDPSPPEKLKFEQALAHGFTLAGRFGDFELLRKTNADPGQCG